MAKSVRLVGLLSIIFGVVALVGGIATWTLVTTQLAAEKITVPADSPLLPGAKVQDPLSAYAQADIINHHALTATGGKTYAELGALITQAKNAGDQASVDKYTAQRTTIMNGSFLRASLFTSVLSYGVSLLVIGLGVMFLLLGWALISIARGLAPAAVAARTDAPVVESRRETVAETTRE